MFSTPGIACEIDLPLVRSLIISPTILIIFLIGLCDAVVKPDILLPPSHINKASTFSLYIVRKSMDHYLNCPMAGDAQKFRVSVGRQAPDKSTAPVIFLCKGNGNSATVPETPIAAAFSHSLVAFCEKGRVMDELILNPLMQCGRLIPAMQGSLPVNTRLGD